MTDERQPCYVGLKPCGCGVGAVLPSRMPVHHAAGYVARWMRKGWAIERVTLAEARDLLQPCTHEAEAARQGDLFVRRFA